MKEYVGHDFEKVDTEINTLVSLATDCECTMWTEINGVTLIAEKGDDTANLRWAFWIAFKHPYILSPKEVRTPKVSDLQATVSTLLERLPQLNLNDYCALIKWFIELQLPSLHNDVDLHLGRINQVFSDGVWRKRNLEAPNRTTREQWAHDVIVWALTNLRSTPIMGYIEPSWRLEANEWLTTHCHGA